MSCIVCATRGGEGSRAVQLEAIRRSKETAVPLTFLYVTDPETVGEGVDASLLPALRAELDWMGSALMHIARHRAELAGLEAGFVIRHGRVRDEIAHYLDESQAQLLLLGAPRGSTANVFGDDAVEQFARAIQDKTGVPVEVIHPNAIQEDDPTHG